MKFCEGQNVSSGNEGVPSPSWLQQAQPAEYAGLEAYFLQSVYLLVMGFFYEGTVAVDEKDALLHGGFWGS